MKLIFATNEDTIHLPQQDKNRKCGGTLQLAVEFHRMKAMNWWPCARLQDR